MSHGDRGKFRVGVYKIKSGKEIKSNKTIKVLGFPTIQVISLVEHIGNVVQ